MRRKCHVSPAPISWFWGKGLVVGWLEWGKFAQKAAFKRFSFSGRVEIADIGL
jgi:hypothetical protein